MRFITRQQRRVYHRERLIVRRMVSVSILLVACFFSEFTLAQTPVARVRVSPDTCTIGDPIIYELTVIRPSSVSLLFPTKKDTASFSPLDILNVQFLPRDTKDESVTERVRYTLASFDTGMQVIPSLTLTYLAGKDTISRRQFTTAASRVYILSLLDTSRTDIADIKDIRSLPLPWWVYGALAAAVLLLCFLGYVIYDRIRKRRLAPVSVPEIRRDPYDIAVEKLRALEWKTLENEADFKQFYVDLSVILREFIELYFAFPALESTSTEILSALERKCSRESVATLSRLFETADMVKFAKYQIGKVEAKDSYEMAFLFLDPFKPTPPGGAKNASDVSALGSTLPSAEKIASITPDKPTL